MLQIPKCDNSEVGKIKVNQPKFGIGKGNASLKAIEKGAISSKRTARWPAKLSGSDPGNANNRL